MFGVFFAAVEKCKTSFLSTVQLQKPKGAAPPAHLTGALYRSWRTREHFNTFAKVFQLCIPKAWLPFCLPHILLNIPFPGHLWSLHPWDCSKNMDVAPGTWFSSEQGGGAGFLLGFDDPKSLFQAEFHTPVTGGLDSLCTCSARRGWKCRVWTQTPRDSLTKTFSNEYVNYPRFPKIPGSF